uniref:Uncharacterized protein n=1 Tax=Rhizophora mucronata TaxID=61149 RepID=A0A2P2R211_RHIMU
MQNWGREQRRRLQCLKNQIVERHREKLNAVTPGQ